MGKSSRKFDLGGLMETVSNLALPDGQLRQLSPQSGDARLDTASVQPAAPEVRMIPLEDIADNKANFYAVDKKSLKPLADSIAMDGLQQ